MKTKKRIYLDKIFLSSTTKLENKEILLQLRKYNLSFKEFNLIFRYSKTEVEDYFFEIFKEKMKETISTMHQKNIEVFKTFEIRAKIIRGI